MNEDYSLISGWMISIWRAMELSGLDFKQACNELKIDKYQARFFYQHLIVVMMNV